MNQPPPNSSLAISSPPLPPHVQSARQLWAEALQTARALHERGGSGSRVVEVLSEYLDETITQIYQAGLREGAAEDAASRTALVLHGGCGRRELAPCSDVDLMLLYDSAADPNVQRLARFVSQGVNDTGFRLGFTSQTPRQACSLAMLEPATFASFIDSRYLAGNRELFEYFFARFRRMAQRRAATLIRSVCASREAERTMFGDTVYLLRPDIKRTRGGLRDVHLIRWIGFLKHGETDFERLAHAKALSLWDTSKLLTASEFLLRLRNELHFQARQPSDRLTKTEQVRIAEKWGYRGTDGLLPVELLMRDYFRHTSDVRYCCDHFVSASQFRGASLLAPLVMRSIDQHFRVGTRQIGAKPGALRDVQSNLELILRLMQGSDLHDKEIEHPTWEGIRQAMGENAEVELTPAAAERFLALLSGTSRLGTLLRRLHELRVLEKIIPGFRHARCLLQFNEYHQYTVDEHSIRAVECATQFMRDADELGACRREIRRSDLLNLALLMHDLGKGYPEDHSELGRRMALATARRLGLPSADAELVAFLVHRHLLMDHLATRRDINDESILAELAATVGSVPTLQMLFVLTCADIAAVGPGTLTDWKRGLLSDLYRNAESFLTGHHGPRARGPRLGRILQQIGQAAGDSERAAWVSERAAALPRGYGEDHPPETIAAQLLELRDLPPREVRCWLSYSEKRKVVELAIAKHQQALAGIFYHMNGMLASLGLRIRGADIKPLDRELVWYRFQFEDPTFQAPPPPARLEEIRQLTLELVNGSWPDQPRFPRTWEFAADQIGEVTLPQIRVQIDNQSAEQATIIDVFAYQKLGLLFTISKKIYEFGLDVSFARTSVYGSRMVCVFYVTTAARTKINDRRQLVRVRRALLVETCRFLGVETPGRVRRRGAAPPTPQEGESP